MRVHQGGDVTRSSSRSVAPRAPVTLVGDRCEQLGGPSRNGGTRINLRSGGADAPRGLLPELSESRTERQTEILEHKIGNGPATPFRATVAPSRAWRVSRFRIDGTTQSADGSHRDGRDGLKAGPVPRRGLFLRAEETCLICSTCRSHRSSSRNPRTPCSRGSSCTASRCPCSSYRSTPLDPCSSCSTCRRRRTDFRSRSWASRSRASREARRSMRRWRSRGPVLGSALVSDRFAAHGSRRRRPSRGGQRSDPWDCRT